MSDLFDKKDILTGLTFDQIELGTKGYFGDTMCALTKAINTNKVETLVKVDPSETYCFGCENGLSYLFFLPADRIKKSPYRPIRSIDELFAFLMPDLKNQKINKYKKVELLLGKKITLRRKEDNFVKVITINEIGFYANDDAKDNYLNSYSVDELFYYYKTLIEGKWIPFGIKGE